MGAGGSVQSGAVNGAAEAAAGEAPANKAEWVVGEGDGDMKALIVVGAKVCVRVTAWHNFNNTG